MTPENEPPERLPVRERPSPPGGRHRRPGPGELPPDAPVLVLAVSGAPTGDTGSGDEIAAQARAGRAELDVRPARIDDSGHGGLGEVLRGLPEGRAVVVVPLVTGPNPQVYDTVSATVRASGVTATITDPLGPHPLLAEALHVRLAESGLARADRIRLLSVGTTVDGIIVATVGGEAAAREADMTAVLLAARLAVPVVAASIDGIPTVADASARLRATGARRLAIAPCIIGSEIGRDRLTAVATEADAGCAEPLGAHAGVVRLVDLRYEVAMDEMYSAEYASE